MRQRRRRRPDADREPGAPLPAQGDAADVHRPWPRLPLDPRDQAARLVGAEDGEDGDAASKRAREPILEQQQICGEHDDLQAHRSGEGEAGEAEAGDPSCRAVDGGLEHAVEQEGVEIGGHNELPQFRSFAGKIDPGNDEHNRVLMIY